MSAPTKVVVDNGCYHLRNMGDVAMLQTAVQRLRHIFPDAELLVPTVSVDLVRRYMGGAPLNPHTWYGRRELRLLPIKYTWVPKSARAKLMQWERVCHRRVPLAAARLGLFWRRLGRGGATTTLDGIRAIRNAHLVVTSGGGYLTDEFRAHARDILDTLELALDAGRPTAMLGQGLGPVTDAALWRQMGAVLPRVNVIALREARVGVPLLHSLGIAEDKIVVTGDDAIEPAYLARNRDLGEKIGVCVRTARYSSLTPEDVRHLGSMLCADARRRRASLQPIPIDWRDAPDSDLQSLCTLLGPQAAHVHWPDADTPLSIIRQVGQCRVVVTGSYHAGVFALAQGIPIVALVRSPYYAGKFWGLAHQFGDGCDVLDLDDVDFARHLIRAIDHAWRSAPRLRANLLAAAKRQIARSRAAYARLQSLVSCN